MTVAAALFRLDDSYAREVPALSVPWAAAPVPAPELLVLNEELASELGADPAALREAPGVLLLVGQAPGGVTTVGEAMQGLGIPTTRALAVVATGEQVLREQPLPGAVLTRVAASHLRVGTFQYAAASGATGR